MRQILEKIREKSLDNQGFQELKAAFDKILPASLRLYLSLVPLLILGDPKQHQKLYPNLKAPLDIFASKQPNVSGRFFRTELGKQWEWVSCR